MRKGFYITMIVILSFVVLGLISFLITTAVMGREFDIFDNEKNVELVREKSYDMNDIKEIDLSLVSNDVKIIKAVDNNIVIKQYAKKNIKDKYKFSSSIYDNKLRIQESEKLCIGFCFNNHSRMEIYIPEAYINNLRVKTVSGDISNNDVINAKIEYLKSTSGDINFTKVTSSDVVITSVSGDIEILEVVSDKLDMKTTSGDIKVNSIISKDQEINSVSGDIEIGKIIGGISVKTTSGEIEIEDFTIQNDSDIKSVSGDVNVSLNAQSTCKLNYSTVSGSKMLPSDDNKIHNGYRLNIKTTSGNIKVR